MNSAPRPLIRYIVITAIALVTLWADLASKRWAEDNLASWDHLLPVMAEEADATLTVGDMFRKRFTNISDAELGGNIIELAPAMALGPDDRLYEKIGSPVPDITGFFVFDNGDLTSFARRLDLVNRLELERNLMKSNPDIPFPSARKQISEQLAQVSVRDFVGTKFDHLSSNELTVTIDKGLFPIPRNIASVKVDSTPKPGQIYLLSKRMIVVIPEFFDFSYVENPNGAWGLLSNLSDKTKRIVFLTLHSLAMLAMFFLVVHPPINGWFPIIVIGAIFGGGLGNFVDRAMMTYVVDFIHMYWRDLHWPRYNIADIGISVGVVGLLLISLIHQPKTKNEEKQ